MNKEKKDKLNKYLNELFIYLNINFEPFMYYLSYIFRLNDKYYDLLYDYNLEDTSTQNNLTYEDIYLIAREIISSINQDYLKDFDSIIASGELDFSYENEYCDSHCWCNFNHSEININREFSYNDVIILVHEFFHYLNGNQTIYTDNRYWLTEFISIYFEFYAMDYLVNKGIPKDEINFKERLKNTFDRVKSIYYIEAPMLAYRFFGIIDENSCNLLNQYEILKIKEQDFNNDCESLLYRLIEKEKQCKIENFKDDYNEYILRRYYGNIFEGYFKYFIGTILALYSRKNCNFNDVIYINDHINDACFDLVDIFKILKIEFDRFEDKSIESLKFFIDNYKIEEGDICKKNILVKV